VIREVAPRRAREPAAERRRARRERAQRRARTTLDRATLPEPLSAPPSRRRAWWLLGWLAASAALHVAVTLVAMRGDRGATRPTDAYSQPVHVSVTEPPPPPTPQPPPPPPPRVTAPRPTPARPTPARPELPPDPVDSEATTEPTPPPPTPTPPPRRIVGLSMESTVVGAGPGFAVGNTRMGTTAAVAEDPTRATALTAELTAARRTRGPQPVYPPALRAQHIEGDVALSVQLDAGGHVVAVTVVQPSEHEEFDRAAVASVWQSAYEPARSSGVAVAHTITFTVRFRLRP
jgi:TonB family protein